MKDVPEIIRRRITQGLTANDQYRLLNAAREKRRKRKARNLKNQLAGGDVNIPILK